MTPDKTKKYKFAGLTVTFDALSCRSLWRGRDSGYRIRLSLTEDELAYQIEQGNAVEVREPREFKTTGNAARVSDRHVLVDEDLPGWAEEVKFEVTIREVLP